MKASPVVHVVCALIEDAEGRLLLAQRPAHKHLGGFWEFPGGKIEPGETTEAALHREIAEELGCAIVLGEALGAVTHAYAEITVCLHPFRARLAVGSPPPETREHAALRWVAAGELNTLKLPEADTPILAEWMAQRAAC